jgi:pterin-4a-carbinolamine dehydratase
MLATMRRVELNEHNEELVNFAQTINFEELFNHAKAYAKVNCEFHQPEISTIRGDVHISFMSHDITSQTGTFATILERCNLSSFSNKVYMDKETGEIGYWVQVSIQYEHKNGGSNGMEVLTAWYRNSTGWIFRNAGN